MSDYTPPDLMGEPVVSIRMKWRAANSQTNTYTEWFEDTDNNLAIIHEIKQKLEESLGSGKSFTLETDDGFASHETACKELHKALSSFHQNNKGRKGRAPSSVEDDMCFEDEEQSVGFIRLHWRAASKKTRTKTEWFENTPSNLDLISSIRRTLEESLGKGGSFLYDFDDGLDSRMAARSYLTALKVPPKTPSPTDPPEPSNDP